ncbi:MAG: helix-turn-helix transcriptional regulator [Chloroflexota bacterium]
MAINQLELDRHQELAEFLRIRRARLAPEKAGLSRGIRRRTPGLRREEVALLAGISPGWYTRLEQGRDINVSVQLLESLARVLQLEDNERTHLFLLALRQPPPVETFSPPTISPALQLFLDQLGTIPVGVVDARFNSIARNRAHCAVFGLYEWQSERDRNIIWRIFTQPGPKDPHWEDLARLCLAQFHAEYGRFVEDPWWAKQIAELSEISPEFRDLWARPDVLNVLDGRKSVDHPRVGELDFEFLLLQRVNFPDLRLLVYTPRSKETADKIAQLLALESDEQD